MDGFVTHVNYDAADPSHAGRPVTVAVIVTWTCADDDTDLASAFDEHRTHATGAMAFPPLHGH